jgi:hypothetical protein
MDSAMPADHRVPVAESHRILDALIDIYDDARNNAPEDRCYVEGAWTETIDEARAYLAAPQAPQKVSDSVRDADYSDKLMRALAACRDAIPIPDQGSALEGDWAAAIGDPLSVPHCVRAYLAARDAQSMGDAWADLWYFVMDEAPLEFERIVTTVSPSQWHSEAHKLMRAKYPVSIPSAQPDSRTLPAELTPPVRGVLSMMLWQTIPIANALRATGRHINRKTEDEQAAALHWLLGIALEHGENWEQAAARALHKLLSEKKGI